MQNLYMTCHVHGHERRHSNECKNLLQEELAGEKACWSPLDSHRWHSNCKAKTIELELDKHFEK